MDNWLRWTLPLQLMRVAFYIPHLATDGVAAIALSWVRQLAVQYPEDRYLVLSDSDLQEPFHERLAAVKLPRRFPLFPFWADVRLYLKLASFKPDLLVNTRSGQAVFGRWPQARVTSLAALAFAGQEVSFAPIPFSGYELLSGEEKLHIKEQWSFGREFFMLAGPLPSESQLTTMLQAFSLFKNRQQSGLRLVLPFSLAQHYPKLAKKIEQYKYKSSLVITEQISPTQMAQLTGAAYALLSVASPGSALMTTVLAWRAGVPLLTVQDQGLSAIAGESLLYAESETKEAIAAVMMQVYKDETLRLQLIRNGQQLLSGFDFSATTAKLREKLRQLAEG